MLKIMRIDKERNKTTVYAKAKSQAEVDEILGRAKEIDNRCGYDMEYWVEILDSEEE